MATTTTNLGLTKPAYTESADIAVINTNMDLIDAEAGTVRTNITTLSDQISTQTPTDLDNAITTGFYYVAGSTTANSPTNIAGMCFVMNSGTIIVTQLVISGTHLYIRRKYNGSWNAWTTVV